MAHGYLRLPAHIVAISKTKTIGSHRCLPRAVEEEGWREEGRCRMIVSTASTKHSIRVEQKGKSIYYSSKSMGVGKGDYVQRKADLHGGMSFAKEYRSYTVRNKDTWSTE